jgi:UPF0755 protein
VNKQLLKELGDKLYQLVLSIVGAVVPLIYYLIIIATISGIGAAFFSVSYLKSPGPLKAEVNVVIPQKTSTIGIAKLLSDSKVIEFPELFAVIIKVYQSSKTLKAGEYAFAPAISPIEVIKKIQSGQVVVRELTIPEGLMSFQVLDIIKNAPAMKGDVPDGIGDGELLPQTYDYHYGDSRAEMVKRMQEAMRKTIDELWEKRAPGLLLNNKHEALVLASIIEKETGVASERPRISAVFLNRLKIGMRLQTDPTVIYAITHGKSVLGRPLAHQDLGVDSNYNTYKNAGLPPGPIANPGRAAIEAAVNPATSNDLYFVASGNGGHVFSSSLAEHNANVVKLRKIIKDNKVKEAD